MICAFVCNHHIVQKVARGRVPGQKGRAENEHTLFLMMRDKGASLREIGTLQAGEWPNQLRQWWPGAPAVLSLTVFSQQRAGHRCGAARMELGGMPPLHSGWCHPTINPLPDLSTAPADDAHPPLEVQQHTYDGVDAEHGGP